MGHLPLPLSVHVMCMPLGPSAMSCAGVTPPPFPAKQEALDVARKAQSARSAAESVARSKRSQAPLPVSIMQLTTLIHETMKDGTLLVIPLITASLASLSKRAPTSLPPSAHSSKRKACALQCTADAANAVA